MTDPAVIAVNSARNFSARNFVRGLALPEPRAPRAPVEPLQFQQGTDEAFVVGSQINAFTQSVANEIRADVTNCTLLAQLAANKKVGTTSAAIYDWYNAYFDVLVNVGWTLTENKLDIYQTSDLDMKVHEAILALAEMFLGAAPAALTMVKTVIGALAKMDESTPWITLFNHESQKINNVAFEMAVADQSPSGEVAISLMAFAIESEKTATQVLFFKFGEGSTVLRKCAGRVTMNEQVLRSVRKDIADKVLTFTSDFVKNIQI
jgi:hypothetical protein